MLAWLFGGGAVREGGTGDNTLPDGRPVHLELYKFDACPYCKRVYLIVDSLGVDIAYRDIRKDPAARAALIALTGGKQVPCLVIDGKPMLESGDIVRWLTGKLGARG